MKISLITDLHFGARGDSQSLLDHQEWFFTEVFFPKLREEGIDTILCLGDTFDRRKVVNIDTLDRVNRFFFEPLQQFEYHSILGNHDTYYTNTNDVNSPKLLHWDNPRHHIYTDDVAEIEIDGCKIAMCPWICADNRERLLRQIQESNASYLMGHFAIDGVEMSRGRVYEGNLKQSFFKNFEAVYSGHFHHPSINGNIEYLGAPYEMDWGDYGGTRGFHILDTRKRRKTLVENDRRLHVLLRYEDEGLEMSDIDALDVSGLKGSYVKIQVVKRTNPFVYEQFVDKVNAAGAADVKIVEDILKVSDFSIEEATTVTNQDTRSIMHKCVFEMNMEDTVGKRLTSFMDDIYSEAVNLR